MITTITTTAAEDQRIAVAFGHKLGLSVNATAAQVKAAIVAWVIQTVTDDENRVAALFASPTPIAPT